MERINPIVPGSMPFLFFFIETITPAIERRSAMNGNVAAVFKSKSNMSLKNWLGPLGAKVQIINKHGAATAKIIPAMASLLVFLLSLLILLSL